MKLNKWWIVLPLIVVSYIAVLALIGIDLLSPSPLELWTISQINQSLDSSIPTDAYEISYTGHRGIGGFLDLSFKAPIVSAERFLSSFCNGVLYKGYDPFNAIDIAEPFSYTVPIELNIYHYQSYSLNTPQTVAGYRCISNKTRNQYQLRAEDIDLKAKFIKLEVKFSCTLCVIPPLNDIYPIEDFPLQVLGLKKTGIGYYPDGKELCVAMQLHGFPNSDSNWDSLIDSKIQISSADKEITTVRVIERIFTYIGKLKVNYAELQVVNQPQKPSTVYQCFEIGANSQDRKITLTVTMTSGEVLTYSWKLIGISTF